MIFEEEMKPSSGAFNLGYPVWIEGILKRILSLDRAEKILSELRDTETKNQNAVDFCGRALKALGASIDGLDDPKIEEFRKIKGPLVFVSNHPFGAVDALGLILIMGKVRTEFKFLANAMLKVLPELDSVLLPVDIMSSDNGAEGSEAKIRANLTAMRNVLRYLEDGGMIGLFPSGEVSSIQSFATRKSVTEIPWKSHVGRIVRRSKATVIPVFFEGQNSALFQYLGLGIPKIRIPLLIREMLKYRRAVTFKIGKPISFSEMDKMDSPELTLFLRERTYQLRDQI